MQRKTKKTYLGLETRHVSSPAGGLLSRVCAVCRGPVATVLVEMARVTRDCVSGNGDGGGDVARSSSDLDRDVLAVDVEM